MAPFEYRVPKIKTLEARYMDGTTCSSCSDMSYDTLYYNPETMTYFSKEQYQENQRLKEELKLKDIEIEEKKKEKDNSIKVLISYFYKKR